MQLIGRGCINDGVRTIIIIMTIKNKCPVDFSPQIRNIIVFSMRKKWTYISFLEQRHPVGSGIMRRLICFPIGRWFVKPGRGFVIIKRVKINHEYMFLCSELQIFIYVSKTKVCAIFFDFRVFVLGRPKYVVSI